jgi:hypothetical protein
MFDRPSADEGALDNESLCEEKVARWKREGKQ